jgi:predicted XRE-type DNA-binding protein
VGGRNVNKAYKSIKVEEPKQRTKEMLLKEKYPVLHLNLNQHTLADIFKVSRQTVNMWMNKEVNRVPNYALVGMELINKKLIRILEEVKNEYTGKY